MLEKLLLARAQAEFPAGRVDQARPDCQGVLLKAIADPPDRPLQLPIL
jgi:hypothetical protein